MIETLPGVTGVSYNINGTGLVTRGQQTLPVSLKGVEPARLAAIAPIDRNLVAGETEELYDLDSDPEELKNLAALPAHAARLRDLRAKTIAELRRTDAKFVDRMPPTKAELTSRQ